MGWHGASWGQGARGLALAVAVAQVAACHAWAPSQSASPVAPALGPSAGAAGAAPKAQVLKGSARAVLRPDGKGRYQLLQGEPGSCFGTPDTSPTRYATVRRWFDHPEEAQDLAEEVTDGYVGGPFVAGSHVLQLRNGLYQTPGVSLPGMEIPPQTRALEVIRYTLYENGEILYEHHWYHPEGWNTANEYACLVGQPPRPSDLRLQHPAFSPARPNRPGDGRKDTTRIEIKSSADWALWVVGRNSPVAHGTGDAAFDWDGRLANGNLMPDGAHTLRLVREVDDELTEQVVIDTKAPQLGSLRVKSIEAHPAGGWLYQLEGQAQDPPGNAGASSGVVSTPGELLGANALADPAATAGGTDANGLLQVGVRFTGPSTDDPSQGGDQGKQLRYTLQVQDAAGNVDQAVGRFKARLLMTGLPVARGRDSLPLQRRLQSASALFQLLVRVGPPAVNIARHLDEHLAEWLAQWLLPDEGQSPPEYLVHPDWLQLGNQVDMGQMGKPAFHYRRQDQPFRMAVGLRLEASNPSTPEVIPVVRIPLRVVVRDQADHGWVRSPQVVVDAGNQFHAGLYEWNLHQDNDPAQGPKAPKGRYAVHVELDVDDASAQNDEHLWLPGLVKVKPKPNEPGLMPLHLGDHQVITEADIQQHGRFEGRRPGLTAHVLHRHFLEDAQATEPNHQKFRRADPLAFPLWVRPQGFAEGNALSQFPGFLAQAEDDPRWRRAEQMMQAVLEKGIPAFKQNLVINLTAQSMPIECRNGIVNWFRLPISHPNGTLYCKSFFPAKVETEEYQKYFNGDVPPAAGAYFTPGPNGERLTPGPDPAQ